jgi:hypothetical protein
VWKFVWQAKLLDAARLISIEVEHSLRKTSDVWITYAWPFAFVLVLCVVRRSSCLSRVRGLVVASVV